MLMREQIPSIPRNLSDLIYPIDNGRAILKVLVKYLRKSAVSFFDL